MKNTFFTMKPQKAGLIKYILLAAVPSAAVGLLFTWDSAAWIFILLTAALLFPKSHSIVVFDNSLTEKALHGRNRFIRKVNTAQITYYRRNWLGEIILLDENGKKLLCVEANMSNFDLFLRWLEQHDIKECKEK